MRIEEIRKAWEQTYEGLPVRSFSEYNKVKREDDKTVHYQVLRVAFEKSVVTLEWKSDEVPGTKEIVKEVKGKYDGGH